MNKKDYIYSLLLLFLSLSLSACGGKKKKLVFYDTHFESTLQESPIKEEIQISGSLNYRNEIVSIPFTERGGVKYVKVSVNGFGFEMIFDTGCSSTSISVAEANYLYQKGFLTEKDVLGISQSQIADGKIVVDMVVNLKEVVLCDKICCRNVVATVSSNNNAPLLLGNEVLDRVASYEVDNANQTINFKIR